MNYKWDRKLNYIYLLIYCVTSTTANWCDTVFLQGKRNGFCHAQSEFFEEVANLDYTSKSVNICYLLKNSLLRTCNSMMKTAVFILQE